MRIWLVSARDAVRTQLWPIPAIAVVAAVLCGLGLPRLDAAVDGDLHWIGGWLFGGDADAARSLLGTVASSLITVTSLTFSLTVVTLQLASSQFSPRLLRTFTGDLFVQATLALFLATFAYALTVLRAVRSGSGQREFVPKVAVSLAFVLAVASVLGLVLFLAHLTGQIRVETMLHTVHCDATKTMDAVLSDRDHLAQRPTAPRRPHDALQLMAHSDGFLTWIDQDNLLQTVLDEDALLHLEVYPGIFLVRGTPMGAVWPTRDGNFDQETAARIAGLVAGCLHTGFERTPAQDVGLGLRQLTDVAIKALSPGINDPTTAIHALHHISAFLCDLTDHGLGDHLLTDQAGHVRVTMTRPDLATYVDDGLSQPRRYGATDPQVLTAIYSVLRDLSHRVAPDQQHVVRDQLERLRATARAQSFDPHERAGLARIDQQIEHSLREPGSSSSH